MDMEFHMGNLNFQYLNQSVDCHSQVVAQPFIDQQYFVNRQIRLEQSVFQESQDILKNYLPIENQDDFIYCASQFSKIFSIEHQPLHLSQKIQTKFTNYRNSENLYNILIFKNKKHYEKSFIKYLDFKIYEQIIILWKWKNQKDIISGEIYLYDLDGELIYVILNINFIKDARKIENILRKKLKYIKNIYLVQFNEATIQLGIFQMMIEICLDKVDSQQNSEYQPKSSNKQFKQNGKFQQKKVMLIVTSQKFHEERLLFCVDNDFKYIKNADKSSTIKNCSLLFYENNDEISKSVRHGINTIKQINQFIENKLLKFNLNFQKTNNGTIFTMYALYYNFIIYQRKKAVMDHQQNLKIQSQEHSLSDSVGVNLLELFFENRKKFIKRNKKISVQQLKHYPEKIKKNCKFCMLCKDKKTKYKCKGCSQKYQKDIPLCVIHFAQFHEDIQLYTTNLQKKYQKNAKEVMKMKLLKQSDQEKNFSESGQFTQKKDMQNDKLSYEIKQQYIQQSDNTLVQKSFVIKQKWKNVIRDAEYIQNQVQTFVSHSDIQEKISFVSKLANLMFSKNIIKQQNS